MGTILKLLLFVTVTIDTLFATQTFYKQHQNEKFCELSKTLENQCASYCFMVVKPLLSMSVECQKKDALILELQKKLEEAKIKTAILETSLKEKDNQCQLKIDHAKEVLTIKLDNANKELKTTIQNKDEQIRLLQLTVPPSSSVKKIDRVQENATIPSNCYGYGKSNQIQMIQLPGIEAFPVKCEVNSVGFGWTLIQSRMNGKLDFNRNWTEYKNGFGDFNAEYFIGLEKLHRLTFHEPHELYILMKDARFQVRSARYNHFKIDNEQSDYKLISLGNFTGYSIDSLRENLNMKFSTFDRDNDGSMSMNCALQRSSGWWFNSCGISNLNGVYRDSDPFSRISWQLNGDILTTVYMLIRPIRSNL